MPELRASLLLNLLTLLAATVCLGRNADAQSSVFETILVSKKIGLDATSLAKYLKELHPTGQQRERVELLIRQLGDSKFLIRERATAELMSLRLLDKALLAAAKTSIDPEVRWRAKLIQPKQKSHEELYAFFQVIAQRKLPGVLPDLFSAIAYCRDPSTQQAILRAITACVQRADVELLRKTIRNSNVNVRIAAATALSTTLGKEARSDLYSLLKDDHDRVKIAAASLIAEFADRKCLATLVALLASDDLIVRVTAVSKLRQLSGKHLQFTAYATPELRAKGMARWKTWVHGDGMKAKLLLPQTRSVTRHSHLGGHTLLAFGDRADKVSEYDEKGREVWSYPARNPRSAEKLPNGNVLIAECRGHRVIEVNSKGTIVWQFKLTMPLTVQPLTNGNLLIAQHEVSQVVEVNRMGEVVWKYPVRGKCCAASRLDNGNTLIAAYGASVMEVTPQGTVVWEYADMPKCHGCFPLPNGNVLISDQPNGRVIEVTREKKIVWDCRHAGAVDAFRLPNGNTLISGSYQFVEMTPDKRIVWSKGNNTYWTARR